MAKLGRKGGRKGAQALTPEERSERARLGGLAKAKNASKKTNTE